MRKRDKKYIGKRTKIDFTKHEIEIIEHNTAIIHEFKKPDTKIHSIVFINACGVLSVTGDFGNWIFSRQFIPGALSDRVSDQYWDEKLRINSTQQPQKFDPDKTRLELLDFKKQLIEDFSQDGDDVINKIEEWCSNLENSLNYCSEFEYMRAVYEDIPDFVDLESIPIATIRDSSLNAVYDAFDIMCDKLATEILINN